MRNLFFNGIFFQLFLLHFIIIVTILCYLQIYIQFIVTFYRMLNKQSFHFIKYLFYLDTISVGIHFNTGSTAHHYKEDIASLFTLDIRTWRYDQIGLLQMWYLWGIIEASPEEQKRMRDRLQCIDVRRLLSAW